MICNPYAKKASPVWTKRQEVSKSTVVSNKRDKASNVSETKEKKKIPSKDVRRPKKRVVSVSAQLKREIAQLKKKKETAKRQQILDQQKQELQKRKREKRERKELVQEMQHRERLQKKEAMRQKLLHNLKEREQLETQRLQKTLETKSPPPLPPRLPVLQAPPLPPPPPKEENEDAILEAIIQDLEQPQDEQSFLQHQLQNSISSSAPVHPVHNHTYISHNHFSQPYNSFQPYRNFLPYNNYVQPPFTYYQPYQPPPPPPPPAMILCTSPLQDNYPFARSHMPLTCSIQLKKKSLKESFGVNVRYHTKYLYQEFAPPTTNKDSTENQVETTISCSPTEQTSIALVQTKKKRRKRTKLGVMSVVNFHPTMDTKDNLYPGDIILSIDGTDLGGQTFTNACKLFPKLNNQHAKSIDKQNDISTDDVITCNVTVAREKRVIKILSKLSKLSQPITPKPNKSKELNNQSKGGESIKTTSKELTNNITRQTQVQQQQQMPMIPFLVDDKTNIIISGQFSKDEVKLWVDSIDAYLFASPKTSLGEFEMKQRNVHALTNRHKYELNIIHLALKQTSQKYWKQTWQGQSKEECLTDLQRSNLRSSPRPNRGCKCGATHHQYVYDLKCPLYRNIRSLLPSDHTWNTSKIETEIKSSKLDKVDASKLNGIGTAYLERLKKLKEAKDNDARETKFVQDMELQQVSKLKMAVFAPRLLTVMVLSAIFHIYSTKDNSSDERKQTQVINEPQKDLKGSERKVITKDNFYSNESTLGKRSYNEMSPSEDPHADKKRNSTQSICSDILAQILLYISRTWGHVFTELDHVDYAW